VIKLQGRKVKRVSNMWRHPKSQFALDLGGGPVNKRYHVDRSFLPLLLPDQPFGVLPGSGPVAKMTELAVFSLATTVCFEHEVHAWLALAAVVHECI